MIISEATEARIVKAMEHGAVLTFHCWGHYNWGEWMSGVSKITLEHNDSHLLLTTKYRTDEYYFVPCDEDGKSWLRHGEYSQLASASDLARQIIKRDDVRSEYAGYRGDHDTEWREIYVHKSHPVPRVISEWWNAELQSQYGEDIPW